MPTLTSKTLASADWSGGVLVLKFKTGETYSYAGVPAAVYKGLLGAPSAGSYFQREIRGKYEGKKV